MYPSVCVLSVGRLSRVLAKEIENANFSVDFIFREVLMQDDTTPPVDWQDFDVFLSSGHNAKILKEKIDKPIITIEPTISDILLAIRKAARFDPTPVLIPYEMDLSVLQQIEDILSIDVILEPYKRTDQGLKEIILKHKLAGRKCIIGSGMVCDLVEQAGMKSVFLYPQESLRKYIAIAADMAVSIQNETYKNIQLSSILDNASSGILFVDDSGRIVRCNPRATQYLHQERNDLENRNLSSAFPPEAIQAILKADRSKTILHPIRGRQYVLKIIPIKNKDVVTNHLVYIDDTDSVQRTERHIRREALLQRGFVAKRSFDDYQTASPIFLKTLNSAKKFSLSDESIVILGETGVGKEVLAQSIHNYSTRAQGAFVAVNCAAIPENLLESELFGYSEGAFTGAKKGGKEGLFEMAHQGTIFLDEIGEIGPALQSKLLRVIQERQVLPVGGSKLTPFDARIIVATNRNLWELVRKGNFREDLYYRLNVLELEIPPLRNRSEDIIALFTGFLESFSPQLASQLSAQKGELEAILCAHHWPGNVRELENFSRMLGVFLDPEQKGTSLIKEIADSLGKKIRQPVEASPSTSSFSARKLNALDEAAEIRRVLDECSGHHTRAAEQLGMHRVTLWRKRKQYNI